MLNNIILTVGFNGKVLFIYYVHEERGRDDHIILGNSAEGCGWCFRKGDFYGTLDLHKSKKQLSFFHHKFFFYILFVFCTFNCYSSSLKLITHFVVNL